MTKEPKLDRAKRQIPEWEKYDKEIADLAKRISQRLEKEKRLGILKIVGNDNGKDETAAVNVSSVGKEKTLSHEEL